MRRTLLVLSAFALTAGCRDDPPPAPRVPPVQIHPAAMEGLADGLASAVAGASAEPAVGASTAPAASASAEPAVPASRPAPLRTWSFDKDKPGEPPAGFDFAASAGKPGKWTVKAEPGAPSAPNVLAQLDGDKTDARFLTAVAAEPSVRDAQVSVRCKPVAGKVDQACGVVARFRDAKSYYVARANALEKNVNLYVVKDGKRSLLGGWTGATFGDAWHELRLDAKGDHLGVYWDGTRVYETDDKTFPEAGRVGVWTKADSVTYFDELSVTPL